MLRKFLLYLSNAGWARQIATHWGVAQRVARRFVAGESIDEAIEATRQLNQQGIDVTLDYLGESVLEAKDTEAVVSMYQTLVERIAAEKLASTVSVKLTHLGLDIGEALCVNNLRHIASTAKAYDIGITIDMESTAYTDTTLRIYRTLRDEYDFTNIGTVIQAYLYRSEKDMQELTAEGAHIRLCKGAYLEPANLAFPLKADVDKNYLHLMEVFLKGGDSSYLCLATHDEAMIQGAESFIQNEQISGDRFEFQMLYGIRTDRQLELAQNHRVRVYVPFGEAWYPYFMRRLAERPANVWFFAKNFFG